MFYIVRFMLGDVLFYAYLCNAKGKDYSALTGLWEGGMAFGDRANALSSVISPLQGYW